MGGWLNWGDDDDDDYDDFHHHHAVLVAFVRDGMRKGYKYPLLSPFSAFSSAHFLDIVSGVLKRIS